MDLEELLGFLRAQSWAVEASVSDAGRPQAAVIGIAVTDELELLFDAFGESRKAQNLRKDPHVAFVIGWDDAQTVQYEGVADEPQAAELARLKELYFNRFPDGPDRALLPDITYFRVRPTWIRYSDFRGAEPVVVTLDPKALLTGGPS